MSKFGRYPENRLDIRIDENGNVTYEENAEFKKYYQPTKEEIEEELESLRDQRAEMELNEPYGLDSLEHEDWEDEMNDLDERILEMEEMLESMN